MNPEMSSLRPDSAVASESTMHLEYLYGPQWREVMDIVERAAQLSVAEREKLADHPGALARSGMGALSAEGLAGLLGGPNGTSNNMHALHTAADTAREFGRTRQFQIATVLAGQSVSSPSVGRTEGLQGLLQSLGSIDAATVVTYAVAATVLGDLVGCGKFTREIYDELMRPWLETIG
ncbi:hypothetical protein [Nocardia sp. NPDC051570]|uniref:hypothetical protein n=1 Tax=Nocardia sp. NPDC051570 TaxID=3364324 RepID=UPI0037A24B1C